MQIHQKNGIFFATATFQEKDTLKAAGFWWHGITNCRPRCPACRADIGKCWWTADITVAAKLKQYADTDVAQAISEYEKNIVDSRQTASNIEVPAPDGLAYYPFQLAGIAYALQRPHTLIGDEMGLGKTIQALGVANATNAQNILIICPASLRLNWQREAKRWLVNNKHTYYVAENTKSVPLDATIVIINYEKLLKPAVHDSLTSRTWDLLVLDECHYIKNRKSKRSRAVLGFRNRKGLIQCATRVIALTGTPILNRPIEIQPLASKFRPDLFGSFFWFARRYCGAYQDRWGWHFDGASHVDELQNKLRGSFLIRRLKQDVLNELPPKTRQVLEVPPNQVCQELIQKESHIYDKYVDRIAEARAKVTLARAANNEEEYKAAVARLRDATRATFSELARIRHEVALSKVPFVVEHIQSILDSGTKKLVVFTHHRDVANQIMEAFKDIAVLVTGASPVPARQLAVDQFQNKSRIQLFVGTISTAGLGITLTAASHVVFAELDWVPANVTQAEDRCHRIGQRENVLIQHVVLDGSLDARLAKTLIRKQAIIDAALDNPTDPVQKEQTLITPQEPTYQVPSDYQPTKAEQAWITSALHALAQVCDGAKRVDAIGFNRYDAHIGHRLVARSRNRPLTRGELWLAKKILIKYHRQIGVCPF